MRAFNLPEAGAFREGANLWIIKNNPSLIWWKKIDLSCGYLLSQNLLKQKTPKAPQLQNIIAATNLKLSDLKLSEKHQPQDYLLLGSEDHFLNKWILLCNDLSPAELLDLIEKVALNLQATSIRFFSDSSLVAELEARPSTSSISISYIENT